MCRDLTKVYGGSVHALDRISFSVPAEGIFALIGRNGAGKTTLARILATELMPTSGAASLRGMDIVNDAGRIREMIAVLPQESRAIPWLTPKQAIITYLMYRGVGYGEARAKASESLAEIGMEKYGDRLNRKLSGGQKRKVLVAMVLASDAPIIFVDEPTTGLDPISRAELWSIFKKLKKNHFIFLTTHYLEEAERLADRIGVLHEGRLKEIGTLEEIRKKTKYQYSIRVLQKGKMPGIKEGEQIVGDDGCIQIMTTEKEADLISTKLIQEKTRFSINPVSLEDVFYYLVRKPIGEEALEREEW